ncbi:FtsK/SpoIIIE family DNA translocase [Aminipila sp.]|uniref:FtsK/SpoIIIE family DNA translocase n=1 Tax=Aminipila sp. TaxID=2060095 RepID=UPI002897E421|nr:DNA translocase FtsK [Aminipila sp.]
MAEEKKKRGRPPGSKNKNSGTAKNARNSAAKKTVQSKNMTGSRVKDEIWAVIIIAVGIFFAISIQTKAAGELGIGIKNFFLGCFGQVAIILPYYLILYGALLFINKTTHINKRSAALLLVSFLMFSIIFSGRFIATDKISFGYIDFAGWFQAGIKMTNGGAVGMFLALIVIVAVGTTGLYIFATLVIIVCMMLIVNTPISQFIDNYKIKKQVKKEMAEQAAAEEAEVMAEKQKQLELDLKKSYAPMVQQSKVNEKKKNILDYMKDDRLFKGNKEKEASAELKTEAEPEVKISYGLEESVQVPAGFGLSNDAAAAPVIPPEPVAAVNKTVDIAGLKIKGYEEPAAEILHETETLRKEDVESSQQMQMKLTKQEAASAKLDPAELNLSKSSEAMVNYEFPSIELLNKNNTNKNDAALTNNLKAKAAKLEKTLQDFKVDAKVVQVTQGPAVTRYEIHPNTSVKVSSIAPIPGKAAVGIEVENEKINMVTVREIIDSREFRESKSKITFAVGKDIAGKAIVADLKSMPHMLIAGSTGSGKSVCINSIITSILYKAKPDEVKFVLIDPKVVELGNYNGIPHMLIPVVTEPSKAAAALNWAVAEMTDRYKKFAEEGVRDLAGFNELVKEKGEPDRFMPQIVIIIDELADLMMAAPSQVEESICRLAQMARAAGMHLIVATQRPSVDIITGVIKANIPSRIAFAVSSQFDSRTILDMAGAEKLVGKGDMLFNPLGSGKPVRVQGNFISDSEVHSVIEHLKKQCTETEYASDVICSIEKANTPEVSDDGDELLADAIETVVRAEQASVSMLQRRFRIGYNRAARIVDMMEARGIIGPADGSRPRQVLMTLDELMNMRSDGEAVLEDKGVPEEI